MTPRAATPKIDENLRPFILRVGPEHKERWWGLDWTRHIKAGNPPPSLFDCELKAAARDKGPEQGGRGRFQHMKTACRWLAPQFDWHDWSETRLRLFCDLDAKPRSAPRWHLWAGSASSGKSHDAVWFGVTWWLMAPAESAFVMTTTTAKMGRKRLWSVVADIYQGMIGMGIPPMGSFRDSDQEWQWQRGDAKHSISLIAVESGSIQKAVDAIKGHHVSRVLVLIDEMDSTPEAIVSACANLQAGAITEFAVIGTSNPDSRFSSFGKMAEPEDGWGAVNENTEEYRSRTGAVVLHFDGRKSPNVKAGKVVCRHLITSEQMAAIEKQYGLSSIDYWRNVIGWFPPEGICRTVFSEAMFLSTESHLGCWREDDKRFEPGAFQWHTRRTRIAAIDPAFTAGGDRCRYRSADIGDLPDGRMAIQLVRSVTIAINPHSADPVNDQLAESVMRLCEEDGVRREHLALDDTSGGLGDRLVTKWGTGFHRVHFGASPTDRPVSLDDARLCSEVYTNFVTELWFTGRWFVEAGLVKGCDSDLMRECVSRLVFEVGKKKQVEPKSAGLRGGVRRQGMKERCGFSPDDADAFVLLCEMARRLGAIPGGKPQETIHGDDEWVDQQRQLDNCLVPSYSET